MKSRTFVTASRHAPFFSTPDVPRSRHYPLCNEIAHGTRYFGVLLVWHRKWETDLGRVSKNITRRANYWKTRGRKGQMDRQKNFTWTLK